MPHILMIATGGTIACCETERGLSPALDGTALLGALPELSALCTVETLDLMQLDSTDVTAADRQRMAQAVWQNREKFDGFVLTHGTDTLAYTAALLTHLLPHFDKPLVLTGSMLGATVVFTIPVAMGILEEKDRPVMAQGILCGIVTIPLGVLAGGLTAGFPIGMVLRNLIPIVIIAALIALGLWRAENAMVRGFEVFGKLVVAVVTVGLAAAIVEALTGFVIIPGMAPISEGFETVGTIAIVLAGAFPLVFVITKLLRKPLMAAGRWLGINDAAAAGLIASLANSIATFGMVKDMNRRGKVVNIAFAVSAAFVFGDHLGFTAGFAPEMIGPMIVGKLVGGVSAIAVAMWLTAKEEKS